MIDGVWVCYVDMSVLKSFVEDMFGAIQSKEYLKATKEMWKDTSSRKGSLPSGTYKTFKFQKSICVIISVTIQLNGEYRGEDGRTYHLINLF